MRKTYLMIALLFIASEEIHAQQIFQKIREPWKYSIDELNQSADSFAKANDENEAFEEIIRPLLYEFELHQGKDGRIINSSVATWDAWEKYKKQQGQQLKSASNGNWNFLGPTNVTGEKEGIGRINAIEIISSGTWLAGAATGSLWKTTDGGSSWQCLTDGLPDISVSDIAVDPGNSNIIYILTGDGDSEKFPSIGVLKSSDGGLTWQTTGLTWKLDAFVFGNKLIIDPVDPDILWVATSKGIYRTEDAGYSWIHVLSGKRYYDVELKPNNHNYVIVATKDSIFYNKNYPATPDAFLEATTDSPIAGTARIKLAVTAAASNYVYAICVDEEGDLFGIYLSTNSGVDFKQKSDEAPNILGHSDGTDGQGTTDLVLIVNPSDKTEVIVGGIYLHRSTNSGKKFTQMTTGAGLPWIHVDQHCAAWNGSNLVVGNDGGIWESNSSYSSFTGKNNGLAITQYYHVASDPFDYNDWGCGAQDNGVHMAYDGSNIFNQAIYGDGMEIIFHPVFHGVVVAEIQLSEIQISLDGGLSFVDNSPGNGEGAFDTPIEMDVDGTFYTSTEEGLFRGKYKEADVKIDWGEPLPGLSGFDIKYFTELASGISNTNRFYGICRTDDDRVLLKSDNISDASPLFDKPYTADYAGILNSATDIEIDPANSLHLYITVSGYDETIGHVYESWNGAATLDDFSGSLENIPVYCAVSDGSTNHGIYIGTETGVFYRNDIIGDWIFYGNSMPVVSVRDLEVVSSIGKIRAATYGRGVWESDLYGGCDPDITIATADYDQGYYYERVENTIISTAFIEGSTGNIVTYDAGDFVNLKVGFECGAGAELTAKIDGCNTGGNKESLTGTYTGPMSPPDQEEVELNTTYENHFSIYPNPASDRAVITYTLVKAGHVKVRMINIGGKEVADLFNEDLEEGRGQIAISLPPLSKGIYVIQFIDEKEIRLQKLTIQ